MTETTGPQCGAVGIPEHGETHHPDGTVTRIGVTIYRGEIWPAPHDADGNVHRHGAVACLPYCCPCGHEWARRFPLGCWCGWPEQEGTTE